MHPSPRSFFVDELRRALNEQSYGIEAFSITASSSLQATASVTILEGLKFNIKLNLGGFSVDLNKHPPITIKEETTFESIEDLLRSTSPLYEKKRQEVLVRKLEMLM
ncbi:hypothetical protein BDZ94DRAFT_1245562 [Collybia nuda]|uniref:GSKIP domain-containing protein n=1 Tax=Collybia nuda TaxID=64659 RepID=A0A9P5YGH9_9AGAR|nr:hypothetical protein BDZ94DRAFT_1245562 [Collybia nuda]